MTYGEKGMRRILLIDDSEEIFLLIQNTLGKDFHIVWASTLEGGRQSFSKERFDLVLLDIGLPDGDGVHFCSHMQYDIQWKSVPLIFLTARDTMSDVMLGFSVGADDYIKKPFEPKELRARVLAKIKGWGQEGRTHFLSVGDIDVDTANRQAFVTNEDGRRLLDLTSIEFKLLILFVREKGMVLPRDEILDWVWGRGTHVFSRCVDSHVSKLKAKLGSAGQGIHSVRGRGYRFDPVSKNYKQKEMGMGYEKYITC